MQTHVEENKVLGIPLWQIIKLFHNVPENKYWIHQIHKTPEASVSVLTHKLTLFHIQI